MQAITTKYIGPSNVRGSRIKAECAAGTLFYHYNDALSEDGNHSNAAQFLIHKLGWDLPCYGQHWFEGVLKDGRHVFVNGGK